MKSKLKRLASIVLPILFWCAVWEILAITIDHQFLFPGIGPTLTALGSLVISEGFYEAVLFSILRVVIGLIFGSLTGVILAILSFKFTPFKLLFTPIITVIKSTPVASFIVVLWVMLSADALSVFIGFLMVMPIIWQNVLDGLSSIDENLSEVCDVFEFTYVKRARLLLLPTLKKYLIPGLITASGLAWKAEIAAEIIAYTKNSIGQGINDAKYNMDTPTVFAWTLVIILFSIILEKLTKSLLRRSELWV